LAIIAGWVSFKLALTTVPYPDTDDDRDADEDAKVDAAGVGGCDG
jgi:hypothetical protein